MRVFAAFVAAVLLAHGPGHDSKLTTPPVGRTAYALSFAASINGPVPMWPEDPGIWLRNVWEAYLGYCSTPARKERNLPISEWSHSLADGLSWPLFGLKTIRLPKSSLAKAVAAKRPVTVIKQNKKQVLPSGPTPDIINTVRKRVGAEVLAQQDVRLGNLSITEARFLSQVISGLDDDADALGCPENSTVKNYKVNAAPATMNIIDDGQTSKGVCLIIDDPVHPCYHLVKRDGTSPMKADFTAAGSTISATKPAPDGFQDSTGFVFFKINSFGTPSLSHSTAWGLLPNAPPLIQDGNENIQPTDHPFGAYPINVTGAASFSFGATTSVATSVQFGLRVWRASNNIPTDIGTSATQSSTTHAGQLAIADMTEYKAVLPYIILAQGATAATMLSSTFEISGFGQADTGYAWESAGSHVVDPAIRRFLPTHLFAVSSCDAPVTGDNPCNGRMTMFQLEGDDLDFFVQNPDPETIYNKTWENTITQLRRITNHARVGVAGPGMPSGWDVAREVHGTPAHALRDARSALLIVYAGMYQPSVKVYYTMKYNALHIPIGYLGRQPDLFAPESFGRAVYFMKRHYSLSENPQHFEKVKQLIGQVWNNYKGGRSNGQAVVDTLMKVFKTAAPVVTGALMAL
jgi:hypothetical protein